jgi:uncharacterized surface protein with fasciclin (FAS1) repeats
MNVKSLKHNIALSVLAFALVLSPLYANAATDTITGLLNKTGDLSTLKTLVGLAELDGALDSTSSQYTVFAPKDSAFAALPKSVTDALVKPENKSVLAGILKYHVIPSKILSTDLAATQTVTTLNGDTLVVAKSGAGAVTITDKTGGVSTVTTADVEATNGVVHIVDKVLLDKAYDFSTPKTLQDTGLNLIIPAIVSVILVLGAVLIYTRKSSSQN